jgi:hypothetical protein
MQITTIRGAHKPEYRDKIINSLKKGFNSSSYINWSHTSLDEQKVNWVINYALLEGNGSPSKPDYGVYLHTMVWQCILAIKGALFNCCAIIGMKCSWTKLMSILTPRFSKSHLGIATKTLKALLRHSLV